MTDTKALTLQPQSVAQTNPTQAADTYADRLMDELFDGVERALEGDAEALAEQPQPTVAQPDIEAAGDSELTLSFSEGGLPAVLLAERPDADLDHDVSLLAASSPMDEAAIAPKGWKRYLTVNQVLLGAAGLTFAAAIGVLFSQRQQVAGTVDAMPSTSAINSTVSPHAEFLEYLRRSLDVVAQNAGEVASSTAVGTNPGALGNGGIGLPPIGNASSNASLPNSNGSGPINVIERVFERVYVPYQASAPAAPATSTPAAQPPTLPLPSTAPSSANPAAAGLPATNPATVAAAPRYTLVGVLELGDRSAALFEIEGVSHRVYIGEQILGSGWSLVSVANGEAVIRRNGEVQTIYAGQQF